MIISASRRTDIPAFYSRWLVKRLQEGFADVVNPFNTSQTKRVNLLPDAVDAIVFWTRFPAQLLRYLPQIDNSGYRYYFLFTITGYPAEIEPNLPPRGRAIEIFRKLSDKIGRERVIWRYDPIILSSVTDSEYHFRNFEFIARNLEGSTEKVIISFLDFYKKTEKRLQLLSKISGIQWERSLPETAFLESLNQIAQSRGMVMRSCAEEDDLSATGISPGRCIDYDLINRVCSKTPRYQKDSSQRKACRCGKSIDIGAYNTCGFRCAYCYATASFNITARNLRHIDIESKSLNKLPGENHEKA
jgi:DNA repair photolyase